MFVILVNNHSYDRTMFSLFLTAKERANLSNWKYNVEDNSITSKLFKPLWRFFATFMPVTVAPNIISLTGLLCTLYSYYLCYNYLDQYPLLISVISGLLTFAYISLDAVDGMHARNTGNSSPLGELFDHSCDNIGVVFIILNLAQILGISDMHKQWYFVQLAQLVFLDSHISAFKNGVVRFGMFYGPGEFLFCYMCLMFGRAYTDYSFLYDWVTSVCSTLGLLSAETVTMGLTVGLYYTVFAFVVLRILTLKNHYSTRNGFLVSLLARFIPSVLFFLHIGSGTVNTYSIVSQGLAMSILTGDIIVSKMAKRELHPLVPIFIMISLFDNLLCLATCLIYYVSVLCEISYSLRIPLLSIRYNVFCNGVYDVLHVGHMNLFESASNFGNYLKVGVHNDEDVAKYKRTPTMTHAERCDTVSKCRFVDEVIQNAPLNLDKEFLAKHNIHVVMCSVEYDKPDDEYYKVPREMGILQVMPRTEGISTSELMKRIRERK